MTFYSTDHEVIQTALDWLQQGSQVILVTVLRTWGSSPRPPGSLMIMRADVDSVAGVDSVSGSIAGSVSGGCIEADLLARFKAGELSAAFPTCVDYGVNREEATRFGLPCGGRLELLLEELVDLPQLQCLLRHLQQQHLVVRRVNLYSGKVTLDFATPDQVFSYAPDTVSKVFGPRWRMLLIGAGQLSRYVSQLALMLDYQVIVCDPREEYTREWNTPGTHIITSMPDDAVLEYATHPRCLVVALTHDPKLDDMALLDALSSSAFYVGAIGSQRNCDARRERLKQLGLSRQQLQRLHAPVGLDIGSHTPPEIAVSILAEITALRNAASRRQPTTVSTA